MTPTKTKAETKSPIKQAPLPAAGESTRNESLRVVFDEFGFPLTVAAVLSVLAIKDWIQWATGSPPSPGWSTVFALIAIVWASRSALRAVKKSRQLQLGAEGERSVGEMLDGLRRDGYEVFHDIGGDGFNIDHVIIGPPGVFVIETKTRSKPVGRRAMVVYKDSKLFVDGRVPDRDPIAQVQACAKQIRNTIEESTELRPFIKPVVLFPGWWVDHPQHSEVWVMNPRGFLAFLENEPPRLRPAEVAQLATVIQVRHRAMQVVR